MNWCERINHCVAPCDACKAPYIIGQKYYCTKLNYCKEGEWCKNNTCQGIMYSGNYEYKPRDIDPCLNHN